MTHRIINAHCNQNGTTPAFNFAGEEVEAIISELEE